MGEMSVTFPPDLENWIEMRVSEGGYADAADYVRELIRRDRHGLVMDPVPESPEEIAWIREQVAIGLASGVSEQDPFEFLDELAAGKYDGESAT